jgi:threonine/homoserine/homoserine lactone efflux protein
MMLVAFTLAALLLAITPGPGIAYVVARTVAGGRAEGLASCFGTAIGGLVHVLAAALGLSLVVAQSAAAFMVIKYLGAAYLVYLGVRILMRGESSNVEPVTAPGRRRAFLEGIVVEALNVKTALFFLAFLPQFTDPQQPLVPQLLLLGSVCVLFNTLADVVAVLAVARVAGRGARWLARLSGGSLIALGAWLALARRSHA